MDMDNAHRAELQQSTPDGCTSLVEAPVAVVGLGCRFPKAPSPDTFWRLLKDGEDAITEVPAKRWNVHELYESGHPMPGKMNTRWGGFLEGIDHFDAAFFGISAHEAERMDPQQRLLMEVAWEAIENAGLDPKGLAAGNTGVFIGTSTNDYAKLWPDDLRAYDIHALSGNAHSIVANRLSYFLDITGPSIAVDTACSSSLVAVHLACQSLRRGECQMALVGGANVILSPALTVAFSQGGMMAEQGRCRTFDAGADGYVRGEGCGVIVLKMLSDAIASRDNVRAIIRGSAINQDGRTNGLTAPNGLAQQAVLTHALKSAGLLPAQITYVEAHGSATQLGDPIEVHSLRKVLMPRTSTRQTCWLGSVKTNIGHLEAAAGIAGMIKAVLALENQLIPPHLHFDCLNPLISFEGTTFAIPHEACDWIAGKDRRYAMVNSFGFGGTNASIVLEEGGLDLETQLGDPAEFDGPHLLTISASTQDSLRRLAAQYHTWIANNPHVKIEDVCFTSNVGRAHLSARLAFITSTRKEALQSLAEYVEIGQTALLRSAVEKNQRVPKVAFLFEDGPPLCTGMDHEIFLTLPAFREAFGRCIDLLQENQSPGWLGWLTPDTNMYQQIPDQFASPSVSFLMQYAISEVWRSWGIVPSLVIAEGVGKIAAAHIAGALSLNDSIKIVVAMDRYFTTKEPLTHSKKERSGATGGRSVLDIRSAMQAANVLDIIRNMPHHKLRIPAVGIIADKSMLSEQQFFESPWREFGFAEMEPERVTTEMLERKQYLPLLVAPMRKRTQAGALCGSDWTGGINSIIPHFVGGQLAWEPVVKALATLYTTGHSICWSRVHGGKKQGRVALPTYSFERTRHWLDVARALAPAKDAEDMNGKQGLPGGSTLTASQIKADVLNIVASVASIPKNMVIGSANLKNLGFDSLTLFEFTNQILRAYPMISGFNTNILRDEMTVDELAEYIFKMTKGAAIACIRPPMPVNRPEVSAQLATWAGDFVPGKLNRIDRHLVHKAYEQNVLLSRTKQLCQTIVVGEVVQDITHPFFFEHTKDHVTGLYLIESVRQFCTALAHQYFDISMDESFIVERLEAEFVRFAETDEPLFLVAEVQDNNPLVDLRHQMYIRTSVVQGGVVVANIEGAFRMLPPKEYEAIFERRLAGALSRRGVLTPAEAGDVAENTQ